MQPTDRASLEALVRSMWTGSSRAARRALALGTLTVCLALAGAPAEASAQEPSKEAEAPARATKKKAAKPKADKKKKATADKKKGGKKASRAAGGAKKKGGKARAEASVEKAPEKPCLGASVTLDRSGAESERLPLLDCKGRPLESARERISVLARPWAVARPTAPAKHKDGKGTKRADDEAAPGIRLLDAGLVGRIDAIARRFPDRAVSLVSGYRPESKGSLHQSGRAVDLRVAGVDHGELAAFCRTLPDTGCGFYPNSSFVHVDVRLPGTGSVSWIDASGPGEPPRYVTSWPPKEGDETPASPPDVEDEDDAAAASPAPAIAPASVAPAAPATGPSLHPALGTAPRP